MIKKDKKRIKKLAKESLENKWYKIRDGKDGISISDDCSFCKDNNGNGCHWCYIERIEPDFCLFIVNHTTEYIIDFLEQLAKYGELKK